MPLKAAEILGLEEVTFIEPSYDRLIEESNTSLLLSGPAEEARLLVDAEDWPLALALKHGGKWKAANFLYRPPSMEVIERFEQLEGKAFEEERFIWVQAVRDYYCNFIARFVPPAMEDFSQERVEKTKDLIAEVWGEGKENVCLDVGCGSGMGSVALRSSGFTPLAIDNDSSFLSLGLSKGRLDPEWTILLDASIASRYVEPSPYGMVLMAGSINQFNTHIWRAIIDEVLQICDHTLITTETEKEIQLVKMWVESTWRDARIFENQRDEFYDRWVCVVKK